MDVRFSPERKELSNSGNSGSSQILATNISPNFVTTQLFNEDAASKKKKFCFRSFILLFISERKFEGLNQSVLVLSSRPSSLPTEYTDPVHGRHQAPVVPGCTDPQPLVSIATHAGVPQEQHQRQMTTTSRIYEATKSLWRDQQHRPRSTDIKNRRCRKSSDHVLTFDQVLSEVFRRLMKRVKVHTRYIMSIRTHTPRGISVCKGELDCSSGFLM